MPLQSGSLDQQAHLLETAAKTSEGRMFIAARVMDPIKQERDFVAFGRQGFIVDQLAQGDIPYYDLDIKTRAIVMAGRGEVPQERVNVQRVMVPIWPIASYPLISIMDTKLRRFNVIDRVQAKTRCDLAEEEDRMVYGDPTVVDSMTTYGGQNVYSRGQMLDGTYTTGVSAYRAATPTTQTAGSAIEDAFDHVPNAVVSSQIGLTKDVLAAGFAEIYQHDLVPDAVLLNPRQYTDLLLWGRDDIDWETQKEIFETGRLGRIWNTEIQVSKIVPKGTFYIRCGDQYFGVMPILIDLDVMDAPDPRGLSFGFCFYEFLGMAILNAWGVCRGSVTYDGI